MLRTDTTRDQGSCVLHANNNKTKNKDWMVRSMGLGRVGVGEKGDGRGGDGEEEAGEWERGRRRERRVGCVCWGVGWLGVELGVWVFHFFICWFSFLVLVFGTRMFMFQK